MKIARVFPRVTKATPDDELAFYGLPNNRDIEVDEVHVSVTFSYDKKAGEFLAEQWQKAGYNVKISGPAYNKLTYHFEPGMYLKRGFVITSRGCDNNCWFRQRRCVHICCISRFQISMSLKSRTGG